MSTINLSVAMPLSISSWHYSEKWIGLVTFWLKNERANEVLNFHHPKH